MSGNCSVCTYILVICSIVWNPGHPDSQKVYVLSLFRVVCGVWLENVERR